MVELPECWKLYEYRLLHDYHTEVKYWLQLLFCCRCSRTGLLLEQKYKTAILWEDSESFAPMEILEIEFSNVPQCVLVDGKYLMCILWKSKDGKWDIIDAFMIFFWIFCWREGHFALCNHSSSCSFLVQLVCCLVTLCDFYTAQNSCLWE